MSADIVRPTHLLPYSVAQGEWKEDMMDGKGEFKFASGACYSGTWVKNQFMGEGTYTWPDKTTYAGGWADNKCAANLLPSLVRADSSGQKISH